MWRFIAHIILTYRRFLIVLVALITVFMAKKAQEVQWSFDLAKTVPETDPEMMFFKQFKEQYGEDGNLLAIGLNDSAIYEVQNFKRFRYLTDELASLHGVNNVLALPNFHRLVKDSRTRQFKLRQIFDQIPDDQDSLDQLLESAANLRFYSGRLINEENGATLLLLTIQREVLNSRDRTG